MTATGIQPDIGEANGTWSFDKTSDLPITALGELQNLVIEFTNNDTGSGQAVDFDYVWIEVTYIAP